MKIIQNKLVNLVLPKGFTAITIWHLFLRTDTKLTPTLQNHEAIHRVQQAEMTLIGFLLIYVFEWLILATWGVIKGEKNAGYMAYRNIRFEKEAYLHESDLSYLEKRESYSWKKLPFGWK